LLGARRGTGQRSGRGEEKGAKVRESVRSGSEVWDQHRLIICKSKRRECWVGGKSAKRWHPAASNHQNIKGEIRVGLTWMA